MKLPDELKYKLEELQKKYKEKELKDAYSGISERYMNEKRKGQTLLNEEVDVVAYANARMPATYSSVYTAFSKGIEYINEEKIKTLLDIGAGTGAATWAISEFLDFEKITCLEREENMMNIRQIINEGY